MFEELSLDQQRLIVQLPYRAGLYISESDQAGGTESDVQEAQVLSNIIHGFAQDVMGAESIQHIISATLALQEKWPEWIGDLDNVPAECVEVIMLIEESIGHKDSRAFATQMYEIGEAVALAFREYQGGDFFSDLKLRLVFWRDQIAARKAGRREKSFEEYKSISLDERVALKKLAAGLGLTG